MFETGIRQLRMAAAIVTGRAIDPRNVERLVADALATLTTFGSAGDDAQLLLDGPFAEPEGRRVIQEQALRRTARRLARHSPYYRELFCACGVDSGALTLEKLRSIPATTKRDLVERAGDFVLEGARPYLSTRTTGTTGQPVEVWLSRYEIELWPALAALSGLLRDEIRPSDYLQINISSRATAAMQQNITLCRLVGARSRALGVVPVAEALDSLLDGGDAAPTLLATYPSYLATLVRAARRRGCGSEDFKLRRIDCGGEVLSPSLALAAEDTLGARVNDTFAMTEVLPVSGRVCEQGHLHHDLNMGLVEVIDLETGRPAAPGAAGTVVITPYFPYRECMPVFRYDTRDVVRPLTDGELECSLAGVPATTRILGKVDSLLRVGDHVVTTRELVEACEALPGEPWPARFAAHVAPDGIELELSADTAGALPVDELGQMLTTVAGQVPVHCRVVGKQDTELRPVRADLLEYTFTRHRS